MKWIEIAFGLALVITAHVGVFFFGMGFKVYLVLVVIALFIVSHLLLRWYCRKIARQLHGLSVEEKETVLAPLDPVERQKVLERMKKNSSLPADSRNGR